MKPMIKNIQIIIVTTVFVLASAQVFAWSEKGHRKITEDAIHLLPEKYQNTYHQWAEKLKNDSANEIKKAEKAKKNSSSKCDIADLALLPDQIRKEPLGDVFAKYGVTVPNALKPYAERSTSDWHYFNTPYVKPGSKACESQTCDIKEKGNLAQALVALDKALQEPINEKQKILVVAFLIHLIADAHQPLHAMSLMSAPGKHDRGGNDFCVVKKKSGCKQNLHQLWDGGFGIFDKNAPLADNIGDQFLRRVWFQPELWVQESYDIASDVYRLKEGVKPSKKYEEVAELIVSTRTRLAVERIAFYLRTYLQDESERPRLPTNPRGF